MANKLYSLRDLSNILEGELIGNGNALIKNISIDSRMLNNDSETLFFAIKSAKNDGHLYIQDLIEADVSCFVVENLPDNSANANFIKVDNSVKALQKLASWKRSIFDLETFVIVGSNGKTIVKEWLSQALSNKFSIVKSPKSYNSQIGVPLSLWEIEENHQLGIFEAGISQPGEMEVLADMIKADFGLFTNIGSAHSEYFQDDIQKIYEKAKAFKYCKKLFFKNDGILGETLSNLEILKGKELLSWSYSNEADLRILSENKEGNNTRIFATFKGNKKEILTSFTDRASLENTISIWLILLDFGLSDNEIQNEISKFHQIEMRLEQIEGINNCTLINDGYSLDLDSLKIALDFQSTQFKHDKKTLILSSFEQIDNKKHNLFAKISSLIESHSINKLILVGEEICREKDAFKIDEILCFSSTDDLTSALFSKSNRLSFEDEVVLLKGARSFRFEKIVKILENKSHDTVLEINLSNLKHNLDFYRSKLNTQTKMVVMVKAFSYGGGSFEIANVLQYNKVDYLAVAYADEGRELREAGIKLPIMVLNPEKSSYSTIIEYNLEPEIYSFRLLEEFENYVDDFAYPVHIKLNTGMQRLGFDSYDIDNLLLKLKASAKLKVKSVFSHLSSADEANEREFTLNQISLFESMSEKLISQLNYQVDRHILNSAGIENYGDFQYEMVRFGIGLHGISQNENFQKYLKAVASLKTVISQLRTIEKGESVGYSRAFIADKKMKIATLAIGYADGIDRRWGNGIGRVYLNGKYAPIVGRIAMDMLMVDVSDIACKEGDVVEIFGENIHVKELASKIDTIPYEILTKISPRVKRIYISE